MAGNVNSVPAGWQGPVTAVPNIVVAVGYPFLFDPNVAG